MKKIMVFKILLVIVFFAPASFAQKEQVSWFNEYAAIEELEARIYDLPSLKEPVVHAAFLQSVALLKKQLVLIGDYQQEMADLSFMKFPKESASIAAAFKHKSEELKKETQLQQQAIIQQLSLYEIEVYNKSMNLFLEAVLQKNRAIWNKYSKQARYGYVAASALIVAAMIFPPLFVPAVGVYGWILYQNELASAQSLQLENLSPEVRQLIEMSKASLKSDLPEAQILP